MTREHKVNACDNISRVILIPLLSNAKPGENLRQKLFDSNLFFKRLTTILIIVRKAYFHIIAMRLVYSVHCTWCFCALLLSSNFSLFPFQLLLSYTAPVFLTRCTIILVVRVCGYLIYTLQTKNTNSLCVFQSLHVIIIFGKSQTKNTPTLLYEIIFVFSSHYMHMAN